MTPVKVCGITRIEDAVVAAELGAFALGFVFWPPSPRCIGVEQVRVIANALPGDILKVGVFVNQPLEEVRRIAGEAALDIVQLHGEESTAYLRRLEHPVFKAFAVAEELAAERLDAIPNDVTVLLDAHDPVRRGGTGRTIDWALAATASSRRRCVLSGGLTPDNVRDAVAQVRPFAVDVSSGVESSPGIKDHQRLHAFFDSIRHG